MLPIHKRERRSLHLSGAMANLIYVVAFSWGRLGTHCKMSKYSPFLDAVAPLALTRRRLYVCWLIGQLMILFTQLASYVIIFYFVVSRKLFFCQKWVVETWLVVGWGGGIEGLLVYKCGFARKHFMLGKYRGLQSVLDSWPDPQNCSHFLLPPGLTGFLSTPLFRQIPASKLTFFSQYLFIKFGWTPFFWTCYHSHDDHYCLFFAPPRWAWLPDVLFICWIPQRVRWMNTKRVGLDQAKRPNMVGQRWQHCQILIRAIWKLHQFWSQFENLWEEKNV